MALIRMWPEGIPTYSKVQGEEQATKQMINGVKTISVGDLPKAKSKNLDVLAEYGKGNRKQAVSFVVIGKETSALSVSALQLR